TVSTAGAQGADEADDEPALAGTPGTGDLDISVRADVVDGWLPIYVSATEVSEGDGGLPSHGVRMSWYGGGPVFFEDARFTHHVAGESGDLVTAGRGCGPEWDDVTGT